MAINRITDIKSMTLEEVREALAGLGEKPFRGDQLYQWLHQKLAWDYEEMTNLSRSLKEKLKKHYPLARLTLAQLQESKKDGARKYLFALPDGNLVESVLMPYRHGSSVCISSQVGCRMGCRFCASTLAGWERDLLPSEMLEQIYAVIRDTGERVSNVVVMGIGEPLDNYDNVLAFIRLLTGPEGLNLSQRSVTVSTCGLAPQIRRLAGEGLAVTLALSLHAASDEKRRQLMPVARRYPLKEVLAACQEYGEKTGRRVTYEYALIAGVNDGNQEAEELAALLKGLKGHVNLIPVNPIRERDFRQPDRVRTERFKNSLEKYGINATIRREMGRDIEGACGQLRRGYSMNRQL